MYKNTVVCFQLSLKYADFLYFPPSAKITILSKSDRHSDFFDVIQCNFTERLNECAGISMLVCACITDFVMVLTINECLSCLHFRVHYKWK